MLHMFLFYVQNVYACMQGWRQHMNRPMAQVAALAKMYFEHGFQSLPDGRRHGRCSIEGIMFSVRSCRKIRGVQLGLVQIGGVPHLASVHSQGTYINRPEAAGSKNRPKAALVCIAHTAPGGLYPEHARVS